MEGEIINRVAKSGIITLDPEEFFPSQTDIAEIDLRQILWQDAVLREKDLREFAETHSWENYTNQGVAIFCSVDAIIPKWAAMLLAAKLKPYATRVHFGTVDDLARQWMVQNIETMETEAYRDRIVVIKGCGQREISDTVYALLTMKLIGTVKTLMYGEACSTVPIYKAPKAVKL